MNVFITGGAGFIGGHVVNALLEKSRRITILSRDPQHAPQAMRQSPKIQFVTGKITDIDLISENLRGQDVCIHHVLNWGESAVQMLLNDTLSSVAIFEAAGKAGVKHFIFTSSTMAMGEYRDNMHEELPCRALDYYCASKASSEQFLLGASHVYKTMRCNIVRPGYVFGMPAFPGGKAESDARVQDAVKKARQNADITFMDNEGTQFISGADLARVYKAILESDVNRQIFLACGSRFITWEKISRYAIELTGSKSRVVLTPNTHRYEPFIFNVGKIKKQFGLEFDSWPQMAQRVEYLARV